MFLSPSKMRGVGSHRLAAFVLLLAVFFLPLHFHFAIATPQISKECSCVYGSRTQIGLTPASSDWTPTFQPSLVVAYEPQVPGCFSIRSQSARAPPSNYPL